MRFKKTAIVAMLLLIIIFFSQFKKQDVFMLTDQRSEVPCCTKVLFFNDFMPDDLSCSVLSGAEASNLLHKIKHENFRASIGVVLHPSSRLHGIMGSLCVIPDWMEVLPHEWTPYLRKCVYSLYDPWCQLLYLSEDCGELGWDYSEGFCVSNVPPSMLGVDMGKVERHFSELQKRKSHASIGTEEASK